MESFTHNSDTIVAISTAPVASAIGIIRLSGTSTLQILEAICRSPSGKIPAFEKEPRKQLYCRLVDADGRLVDQSLVCYFKNPASYTGEDMAELSLHGNPILLNELIQLTIQTGLCRPAEPGEFTRRAYLNDKLDLTQAEAVHRIISARSRLEIEASRKNLDGSLSRMISNIRSKIIHIKAEMSAQVDFSTEDLSFETRQEQQNRIHELIKLIDEMIVRGDQTRHFGSGIQITLVGIPNAGKSSLLNFLSGRDRAIVSATPGTTRDYIDEQIQIEGIPVRLIDTAGLRDSTDEIEKLGIRKSLKNARESQLIFHLIDGEKYPYELPQIGQGVPVIFLINKKERPDYQFNSRDAQLEGEIFEISCKTGAGIEALRNYIGNFVKNSIDMEDCLFLEDRHKFHLEKIRQALLGILELWDQNAPDEIVVLEADLALEHTGMITGKIDTEEILGRIFSMFCVGK